MTTTNILLAAFAGYVLVCNSLRFLRRNRRHAALPYKTYDDFSNMTTDDAYEIVKYCMSLEFPLISLKALEFALFRTYGIPTISKLLCQTQQLSQQEYASRRYADTNILISEFMAHPPNSERANAAIARMNYLHNRYQKSNLISNDDMLYTLALFILEIERWIALYEWRCLTPMEICAFGTLWKSIGDAMGISFAPLTPSTPPTFKNGHAFFHAVKSWASTYESTAMLPSPTNHQLAEETTRILITNVPAFMVPAAKHVVASLMDDRLRKAMLYEKPPAVYPWIVAGVLGTRKWVLRFLVLPRPWGWRVRNVEEGETEGRDGRYHSPAYAVEPWYYKADFWARNSPEAWWRWATGRPFPDGKRYKPDGYRIFELGPANLEGKGVEECTDTFNRLMETSRGGCPFAFK